MKYQGSKTRLAKAIAAVIRPALHADSRYVEPFAGSCAVAVELVPHAGKAWLSDMHEDVTLMWQALVAGWQPPTDVTEDTYAAERIAPPSALRGFVGTTCSFSGKWFGGYARGEGRNFAAEGSRSVLRRAAVLREAGVSVEHCDYRNVQVAAGDVVYLDPPYAGTLRYAATGDFDSEAFWAQATAWVAAGATVFVSEFTAPPGWVVVWEKDRHSSTALNNRGARALDRLFMHESQA